MNRARITVTDVVYLLVAVFSLAAFYPVYDTLLGDAVMPGRVSLVFATVLPLAVLVLLAIIAVEARGGLRS